MWIEQSTFGFMPTKISSCSLSFLMRCRHMKPRTAAWILQEASSCDKGTPLRDLQASWWCVLCILVCGVCVFAYACAAKMMQCPTAWIQHKGSHLFFLYTSLDVFFACACVLSSTCSTQVHAVLHAVHVALTTRGIFECLSVFWCIHIYVRVFANACGTNTTYVWFEQEAAR